MSKTSFKRVVNRTSEAIRCRPTCDRRAGTVNQSNYGIEAPPLTGCGNQAP